LYDVEAVLDECGTKTKIEVLAKWERYHMSWASWEPIDAIPAHFIDTFRKEVKVKWGACRDKDNLEKNSLKAAQVMSPSDAEELTRLREEEQKKSMRPLRIHLPPKRLLRTVEPEAIFRMLTNVHKTLRQVGNEILFKTIDTMDGLEHLRGLVTMKQT